METIVEELRRDRESGARRLEGEYRAGLMTLARRFCADEGDAEELVNRTFAAVVEGIDGYVEQSAFFGWMCQILSNLHAADVRRKSNRTESSDADAVSGAADADATERLFRDVDASLLRDAVAALPDNMREVLLLHYFLDMPVAKIARFLAIPSGTVLSRLHYARLALAGKLGLQKPGVRLLVFALLLAAGLAIGGGVYALGTAVFGSHAEPAEVVPHAESAEPPPSTASTPSTPSIVPTASTVSTASTLSTTSPPETSDMNAKTLLAAASLALAASPASAAWVPTADSTTSAPKFTDGNFVISWNTSNKQLKYESHDASVSTVCDMTTLSEDVDAVAGYSHPTQVAANGFQNKSGITRVVLPEACYGINQQSFSSMADLESVVISSQTRIGGKQAFSSNKKLSTITPHGVAETNGVVFFPETVTAIPSNVFQAANGTGIKHVIAPGATDFGGDACFTGCNGLETVTVKDLKHVYTLCFQNCYSLTNIVVLSRANPFSGIVSFGGTQQFQSCSSWTQPIDFSAATFSSLQTQMFYGAKKIPEFRLPATLTSFDKQALRCDDYALSDPRRIWFYGPPPSYMYWKSGDPDYLWYVPTSKPRQTVFVPEQYAVAWTNALSNHGTWTAITDTDRARADYPTKLEDVMVKIRGPKFDLVPSRVKDSDVLGLSTEGSVYGSYYVVQWREAAPGTIVLIK